MYHLKVKGEGPLTYHLGADYFHDPDGTMVYQPKKYIEKLKETYIRLFNTEPSKRLKTRHKARLVVDGHLTPDPIENIYSGVVSLRNLRLVIFLGKLNNLWGPDIGNAYLEAFTDRIPVKEKLV